VVIFIAVRYEISHKSIDVPNEHISGAFLGFQVSGPLIRNPIRIFGGLVAEKSEENNEDPEPYFSYSNIERHNLSNFKPSYLVSTCDDSSTERGFRVVEPRINLI